MKYLQIFHDRVQILCLLISLHMFVFSCSRDKDPRTSVHPKTDEMVLTLFKGRSIPELIPPLTTTFGPISIEQAYLIQDQLAKKIATVRGSVKGYKIGFASESEQEKFAISEPACGRLYRDQIMENGAILDVNEFFSFNIEAEIAFKVGRRIDKVIKDRNDLKEYIQSVHASFDLFNAWYDLTQGIQTAADFIANSGGSHYFVLGSPVDPEKVDLDNQVLKLFHDGENIYEGHSTAVLGSPWNIMKWIANHELNRGFPLQPGYVILTGKVAPAFKASGVKAKGTYVGDCGDLGKIKVILK